VKRHSFDALSFVFGALFIAACGVLTLDTFDIRGDVITWIGAGALLLVGIVMLLGSRTNNDRA
jgi:small neutral amino acid transporter SnatA (MarC family)